MRHHRGIWIFTGLVVILAAVVLSVRDANAPASPPVFSPVDAVADELTGPQMQMLIETMKACLETDPQARRSNTRSLVNGIAALAEDKIYETADTYYALGVRRAAQRDYEGAEEAYRKAIELRPNWNWAYSGLGILMHTQARMADAEAAFRKAIELDPGWSRAHDDLAILLRLTGRLEEAEAEALRALELRPNAVATRNNFGNLLVALKRYDEAEAEYRAAIAVEPDHPAPYYNLACLASLRGRSAEVVPLLLCAIEFDASYREEARKDDDFDPVRDDPAFQILVNGPSTPPTLPRLPE
ncbi:MAG: tetratricopeptide repeat protein [Candidatus Hydrogenedentes bacterium]|nr:tetratricopeptide repeat protein [Candidatus Hydrogenedentota bacterium]